MAAQGIGSCSDDEAAALGYDEAKAALKRMQCSWIIKDKQGKVVTTLCF